MRTVCVTLAAAQLAWAETAVHKVAEWEVSRVATLNIAEALPGATGKSLIGTTFGPFGKDHIFSVSPLSAGAGAAVSTLSEEFHWPNEVYEVPTDVKSSAQLGNRSLLAVADGFLFPGKSTGGIHLLELGTGTATKSTVTTDKSGWFYHHSEFVDMDGDGLPDLLAARSTQPLLFGKTDSELVWVKNQGGSWGETRVLTKGPGVGFRAVDLDGDGRVEIVATEFFLHRQLAVYSCDASWPACAEAGSVKETVVDLGDGPFFQLQWVDLNGDGRKDILATAQQSKDGSDTVPGKVLAFECPDTWQTKSWTRHVLADGYLPSPQVPKGSGAPGAPSAFVMDASAGGKPHVVLSGDDDGVVDLLAPSSQDAGDWSYSKETLYTSTATTSQGVSTIGTVLVADVDGSGKPELFIPSYAENKLLMFTFDDITLQV